MKSKPVRGVLVALLVILMVACGFVRDWMSVNINFHLGYLYYKWDENPASPIVQNLASGYEYITIWRFKWVMTIATAIVYGAMTAAIGYIAFLERKFVWLTTWAFGIITVLSGIFYVGGSVLGASNAGYAFARAFMDFVQSPLVLMVLIPAYYLSRLGMLNTKPQE